MIKNIYRCLSIKRAMLACSLIAISVLVSCTKNFDAINTDPTQVTPEMLKADNRYIGVFIVQMEKNVFPISNQGTGPNNFGDEMYQITQNLAGDIFSGQQGATGTWFGGSNNTTYNLIPSWTGAYFDRAYIGVFAAYKTIQQTVKTQAPDVYALAQILKVAAFQRATDMYGPMPYTRAGSSDATINYDSQQVIYQSFFKELDSARTVLKDYLVKNPSGKPLVNYDAVYAGDYAKWIRFANSLRLRMAMRIVYADAALAKTNAEDAVNDSYGVFTANGDNAALGTYTNYNYHNPLEVITNSFGDVRMGATMECYLKGYNDPRISSYFKASDFGGYHGVRTGINVDRSGYIKCSAINVNQTTSIPWMSYPEVLFLRAEGALRGWNMGGGGAGILYAQGVTASFAQNNAGDASGYLSDATSTPTSYTDPVNSSNSFNSNPSNITIKWDDNASFEKSLERIITQKWIAVFPDGQEAWSEFRRTGYPKILPVLVNNSSGTINTTTQIRRLPFTQNQYSTNPAGVASGVALLGGPDNGGTKLWWDKK
ncbi:SusD/RagB family nutrient-binding outer membrane lipoprotein [Mucilaginibacter sp. 21P]|uniref:RagB/SusD family nutrient uptake outer membrane protein n=1 Tax=Mucilaginibacter sp. 21P TaxID=2778902 RepID=UPI001C57A97E|nr:RagB/SusD family nutrient uptake outer membrane protein [Mucilaginibacter sp. 21P]QXV64707.1 SusD/RagB family nutrient-binding outer membrane lipoprotein [Mucilaginibacter sp. 21P]